MMGIFVLISENYAQLVTVQDPILNAYFCTKFPNAMVNGCLQLDTILSVTQYSKDTIGLTNRGITNADEVLYFKNCNVIYLNSNKLKTFPTDISRFRSLLRLNLANNQLTEAPSIRYTNSISGDTAIKLVYLHNNQISLLPTSWYNPNIITQVIDLKNNKLTSIPTFQNYPEIKRLDLTGNMLDFEDLIPITLHSSYLTEQFDLLPQKPFFIPNQELEPGNTATIQVPGSVLASNAYYLLKNNTILSSNSSGVFKIENIQLEQAGNYTVQIRNSNFPDPNHYLESFPFYLNVRVVSKNDVTTFSPNGDGIADLLFIDGNGPAKIYSKGGMEIFSIDSLPFEWNGTDKYGAPLIPGLYYITKGDGTVLKALIIN